MLSFIALVSATQSEIRVPGTTLAATMQKAIAGAVLTTDGRVGVSSKPTIVNLSLGQHLGGSKSFEVPIHRFDLGYAGTAAYRLNSLRMTWTKVEARGKEFVITAGFVSDEPTLKGFHQKLGDALVPDVKLKNMRLEARLLPIIDSQRQISYEKPLVTFVHEIDAPLTKLRFRGWEFDALEELTDFRVRIRRVVESEVQKRLEDPKTKSAVSQRMRDQASLIAALKLVPYRFDGTDLIMRHAPNLPLQ